MIKVVIVIKEVSDEETDVTIASFEHKNGATDTERKTMLGLFKRLHSGVKSATVCTADTEGANALIMEALRKKGIDPNEGDET